MARASADATNRSPADSDTPPSSPPSKGGEEGGVEKEPPPDRAADKQPLPPTEEIDVWWGSYAPQTMVPSFLACLVLTGVLIGLAYFVWGLQIDAVRYTLYLLLAAVWWFQLLRWGYRVFGFGYRLTSQRFYIHRGFLYPRIQPLELTAIVQVKALQSPVGRLLGVGDLRLEVQGETRLLLRVHGVARPQQIAKEMERLTKPTLKEKDEQ